MTDYDRIRVLWPDHLGLARGKYLPTHLAHRGTAHCATTFALGYDRSMIPAPGGFLLEVNPEPTDLTSRFDVSLRGPTGEILPDLLERVKRRRAESSGRDGA